MSVSVSVCVSVRLRLWLCTERRGSGGVGGKSEVDKGRVYSLPTPVACFIDRLSQSQTYRSGLAVARVAERCKAAMQAKLMDKHDFIGGSNKPAGVVQATKGA